VLLLLKDSQLYNVLVLHFNIISKVVEIRVGIRTGNNIIRRVEISFPLIKQFQPTFREHSL
jgi:dynactin complex subunit